MAKIPCVTLAAALSLALLTACAGSGVGGEIGSPDLQGTAWTLVKLNGNNPVPDTTITLTFEEREGVQGVGGSAGCNGYGGGYKQDGSSVSFSDLVSTMMACEQPIMDQEISYLGALGSVREFALEGGLLHLRGDGVELVFAPAG